jgi:hypothetical protein
MNKKNSQRLVLTFVRETSSLRLMISFHLVCGTLNTHFKTISLIIRFSHMEGIKTNIANNLWHPLHHIQVAECLRLVYL